MSALQDQPTFANRVGSVIAVPDGGAIDANLRSLGFGLLDEREIQPPKVGRRPAIAPPRRLGPAIKDAFHRAFSRGGSCPDFGETSPSLLTGRASDLGCTAVMSGFSRVDGGSGGDPDIAPALRTGDS